MLACWVEDPDSDSFKKHLARVPSFIWIAEDGLKIQVSSFFILYQYKPMLKPRSGTFFKL